MYAGERPPDGRRPMARAILLCVRRRATYYDLREVPEPLVAELIDGEVIATPRPALPHALTASVIGMRLGPFHGLPGGSGGPGGWWILDEPELHLGGDVLVPDLAGWRRERMPVVPNAAACEQSPDWACEVVSPTTGPVDRGRKMPIYAREQVRYLWLVDPSTRTLEVYRLEGARWVVVSTHAGGAAVRAEPFEAIELELNPWWGEP